jgi:nucleoside-diphosphate-sugar epimerase
MQKCSSEDQSQSARPQVTVLGGAGFIGTVLTEQLMDCGFQVKIGDLKRSSRFPEYSTPCDVRDHTTLREPLEGAIAVINLAAEHRDDVRPISRYHETNVEGASHVCLAARNAGIHKIVFTSSVAVYGFPAGPVDESGPFSPFNAYGKTKLEAESVYKAWAAEDPQRTLVIVRPTVIFGEGNRGNVYNLLHQIASGRFLMVGSGKNIKSMAYVGNIAAYLVHALSLGPGVRVFNYVDGPDMDTNTLIEHIRDCMHKPGSVPRIPKALALTGGYVLDGLARLTGRPFPISAIRIRKFCESTQFRADHIANSGFKPPFSLTEGLARTIQFDFPAK